MGCESLANPLCGFVLSSSELLTSTTFAETVPCLCSFVRARCHVLPSGHGFPRVYVTVPQCVSLLEETCTEPTMSGSKTMKKLTRSVCMCVCTPL